jgi:hypothetical protein
MDLHIAGPGYSVDTDPGIQEIRTGIGVAVPWADHFDFLTCRAAKFLSPGFQFPTELKKFLIHEIIFCFIAFISKYACPSGKIHQAIDFYI